MDLSRTHRLGPRAFLLFLSRHTKWPLAALVLLSLAWFLRQDLPEKYRVFSEYGIKAGLLVAAAVLVFKMIRSYFEYKGYAYRFEDEFFHITRGYLVRQEIGVVYHQIQTVTLRHGLSDRAMGVTHLVIVMNGTREGPSEVILPALQAEKARLVQKELLRQARVRATGAAVPPEEVWR